MCRAQAVLSIPKTHPPIHSGVTSLPTLPTRHKRPVAPEHVSTLKSWPIVLRWWYQDPEVHLQRAYLPGSQWQQGWWEHKPSGWCWANRGIQLLDHFCCDFFKLLLATKSQFLQPSKGGFPSLLESVWWFLRLTARNPEEYTCLIQINELCCPPWSSTGYSENSSLPLSVPAFKQLRECFSFAFCEMKILVISSLLPTSSKIQTFLFDSIIIAAFCVLFINWFWKLKTSQQHLHCAHIQIIWFWEHSVVSRRCHHPISWSLSLSNKNDPAIKPNEFFLFS